MQPDSQANREENKETESAPGIFRYMSQKILLFTLKQFLDWETNYAFKYNFALFISAHVNPPLRDPKPLKNRNCLSA